MVHSENEFPLLKFIKFPQSSLVIDARLLLVVILMHGVLAVVVVPELLSVRQHGEEYTAHAAYPEVLR